MESISKLVENMTNSWVLDMEKQGETPTESEKEYARNVFKLMTVSSGVMNQSNKER